MAEVAQGLQSNLALAAVDRIKTNVTAKATCSIFNRIVEFKFNGIVFLVLHCLYHIGFHIVK